jgi:hypothetical protein
MTHYCAEFALNSWKPNGGALFFGYIGYLLAGSLTSNWFVRVLLGVALVVVIFVK